MQIERDFTSKNVTLSFDNGTRIELSGEETKEFDARIEKLRNTGE